MGTTRSARKTTAPYGEWSSPLTTDLLTAGSRRLSEAALDGAAAYWLEGRPADHGRTVLMRREPDGRLREVTSAPLNVRSRVHEYGGGAAVMHDGTAYVVNLADQCVYRVDPAGDGRRLTPEGSLRWGDLAVSPDGRWLYAVREDHSPHPAHPVNTLVRISTDGAGRDGGQVLVTGPDFVSSPRPSPDGGRLAWVQWNHPDMPWDATELFVADLRADGSLSAPLRVAGGPGVSVMQPQWGPAGQLRFLSDRPGFWNLYESAPDRPDGSPPRALLSKENDFGYPAWMLLGASSYGAGQDGRILCSWYAEGLGRLGLLDPATGRLDELGLGQSSVGSVRAVGTQAALTLAYPDRPSAVVLLDLATGGTEVLRTAQTGAPDPAYLSRPEPVTWTSESGAPVHGLFYAPRNPEFTAPEGERPPLLVTSHGGPTGMTPPAYDPLHQLWTSRGFAMLDVNYGGSAGYGRAYRERLHGRWGVADVDDCVSGAVAMAEAGRADRDRLAIRGGSAGGYTTLAALAFRDTFAAGASYYGVSDLEALARDTHKFESRYLDRLVGPLPGARATYAERSPIHHADGVSAPVLLLQGADDRVVPPSQAELIADVLRERGVPVELVVFEGEGHGFRGGEAITAAFRTELAFYGRVFGFAPAPG